MICTKCKTTTPTEGWSITKGYCRICWREYSREYRNRRRDAIRANGKRSVLKIRSQIDDYLLTVLESGCVDCGESDRRCLEFDHVDPLTKFKGVAQMRFGRYSLERVKQEVEKCVVRCANCHRKRTAIQFEWYNMPDETASEVVTLTK